MTECEGSFEFRGVTLEWETANDDTLDAPWDRSDCHGPVRFAGGWGKLEKRAGERVLNPNGRRGDCIYLYDWQAALKIAKRDGWGEVRPNETKGQRAARAVADDFEFLASWLRDEWRYIGVIVTHPASGAQASLWGIESNAGDYVIEVRNDLACEVLSDPAFKLEQSRPNCIQVLRAMLTDSDECAARVRNNTADESDAAAVLLPAQREAVQVAIKLLTR